jgi:hypothetical protein
MAWLGHAGSQTSQLMQQSAIFSDIVGVLQVQGRRRAAGARPAAYLPVSTNT